MQNIKYIGTKPVENAYFDRTGIIWTPGMTATVLDEVVANEMLKHTDVFHDSGDASIAALSEAVTRGKAAVAPQDKAEAAPTITVSAANASPGAGMSVTIDRTDPTIRYFGARQVSDVNWGYYRNESVTSTLDRGDFFWYDFMIDSPLFEVCMIYDGKLHYRAWVDGVPLQTYVTQVAASSGSYQVKFDFGGIRKPRRITVCQNAGFYRINCGPLDTVWKVGVPFNRSACVLGDSWGLGGGAIAGYPHQLGLSLGIDNMYSASQAGTGYVNPGSGGGRQKYRDRLAVDIAPFAPNDLFVVGSINDLAYTPAQVAAEATALYSAAAELLPYTRLIVVGIQYPSATPSATSDAIDVAVQAAAASARNVAGYISTKGWITGTGTVSATTGSGNADLFRSADGNHLSDAGYSYWARRIALRCKELGLF